MTDWKILQSDWLRTFWPISRTKTFPSMDLCRAKANNINFHYRPNSVKINNKILAYFGPIFPILKTKKIFQENLALPHTTLHLILASCQNSEKIIHTIPRKHPDKQKDRRKYGRTERPYFIGPFQLALSV